MSRLLVTSINAKIPLLQAVRDAIARTRCGLSLLGADARAKCAGRHFVDDFWTLSPELLGDFPRFLEALHSRHVTAIIPTRDGELPFFAHYAEAFRRAGIDVLISPPETILTCQDKLRFAQTGASLGWPVIPTALTPALLPGSPRRLVVKERTGSGSRSIGLDLTREQAQKHAEGVQEPVFQPYVQGEEFSIDVYTSRTGFVGAVARKRVEVVHGESRITTTVQDATLRDLGRRVATELNLYGPAVIQAIRDHEGRIHLVECNARFGGASTLSIAAGLDVFGWFLREIRREGIDSGSFSPVTEPLTQIRTPHDTLLRG